MSETFISHSTQDDEVVEAIRHSLDRHRVFGWTDSRRMQPGDSVEPKIEQSIQRASHFVVVLSAKAMNSEWVMKEVEIAKRVRDQKPGYRIIPILLDGIKANIVGPWLGESIVTIQIAPQHDSVAEGVARLVSVLHQDLLIPPGQTPERTARPAAGRFGAGTHQPVARHHRRDVAGSGHRPAGVSAGRGRTDHWRVVPLYRAAGSDRSRRPALVSGELLPLDQRRLP